MPATSYLPACVAALSFLCAPTGRADSATTEERLWRESAWIEFGGGIISDVSGSLKTIGATNTLEQSGDLSFEPGFAVYGGFREAMSQWIAIEVQTGFLYNGIDEMALAGGGSWSPDASLMQVPAMANLVLQVPTQTALTPYLGAGAGALINWLDIDDLIATPDGTLAQVDESSTEINFAYQLFAGLRYNLPSGGALSVAYHFIGGSSPQWSLDSSDTGARVAKLDADDLIIHSLTVGFHIPF